MQLFTGSARADLEEHRLAPTMLREIFVNRFSRWEAHQQNNKERYWIAWAQNGRILRWGVFASG